MVCWVRWKISQGRPDLAQWLMARLGGAVQLAPHVGFTRSVNMRATCRVTQLALTVRSGAGRRGRRGGVGAAPGGPYTGRGGAAQNNDPRRLVRVREHAPRHAAPQRCRPGRPRTAGASAARLPPAHVRGVASLPSEIQTLSGDSEVITG